jgi:nicotinamide phosphoribosyltransferase
MNALDSITLVDAYKIGHRQQYPNHTEEVYSNFTPRGTRIPGCDAVTFLGLQPMIDKYLMEGLEEFFAKDVDEVCQEYADLVNEYLGPNNGVGTDHIRDWHALGFTPLEFCALPEGTNVPLRVPMFTVRSTHGEKFSWLANYFETLLSASIWMPCTSATSARMLRGLLERYAVKTGSPKEFVDWQGHDFSFRGMPGLEAAKMSASGHLVQFCGTDTVPVISYIKKHYGVPKGYLLAGSVAATEHSVMCAGGQDDELETFNRLLDLYPTGILSVVSDTWDLWNVLTNILPQLKDRIMARDGKLVIRPDSGDPVKIICGDPDAYPGSPANKGVVQLLWELFGGTETAEHFDVLDSHIGCIYGDSISYDRADAILYGLETKGFASCNIVFGVGSFTYQYVTRDTHNFAMKATNVIINGVSKPIFKKPLTDDGTKNSAKGYLAVIRDKNGKLTLINEATPSQLHVSELKPIWRDGSWLDGGRSTWPEVRARARS